MQLHGVLRSPKICFQLNVWKCQQSIDHCSIHNASCEIRAPCVFPGQVWNWFILNRAVPIGHSIYNAYVIWGYV